MKKNTVVKKVSSAIDTLDGWWQANMSHPLSDCIRFNELMQEPQFGSHKWPDPVTSSYGFGQIRLRASQDHLLGAAHTLLCPSKHSTFVLARASIEASAYGYWTLDPDINVEARVLRGAQLRIHDNIEQLKLLRALPNSDSLSEQICELESRIEEIYDLTRGWGLTQTANAKSFASSLPSATTLVAKLLPSEAIGGSLGTLAYRLSSGSVHSVLMALVLSDPSGTFGKSELHDAAKTQHRFSLLFLVLALNGLGKGLIRLAEVNGWNDPSDLLRPALEAGLRALDGEDAG